MIVNAKLLKLIINNLKIKMIKQKLLLKKIR